MPTTFKVFQLGTAVDLDTNDGTPNFSDNAGAIVGQTYGTAADPLSDTITEWSPVDYSGGNPNLYDQSSPSTTADTFSINGTTYTFDSVQWYDNTVITYTDGTTATMDYAIVAQDTDGNLYLMPSIAFNADQGLLEAKDIESVTLGPVQQATHSGLDANRYDLSVVSTICFTQDVLIETDQGEVPAGEIKIGDLVRTYDHGFQPVRFVFKSTQRSLSEDRPVIFEKGAIGNTKTMRVSQKHRLLTTGLHKYINKPLRDDHLIQAKELVNGDTIRIDTECEFVTYVHIMLDEHELLYSHGIISESWQPQQRNLRRSPKIRRELLDHFPEIQSKRRRQWVRREVTIDPKRVEATLARRKNATRNKSAIGIKP